MSGQLPAERTRSRQAQALLLSLVICLLVTLTWWPAQAQGELRVVDSAVDAAFPMRLSFSVAAAGGADITDIRLHYKIVRHSFADVTSEVFVSFAPAPSVQASWDWDMRRTGGLPPGAVIEYWWTVRDATGEEVETIPARFQFSDERFPWRTLSADQVTMYWYEGDQAFAEEMMLAVQDSLERLAGDTGAHLLEPIDIFIYGSAADLRSSLVFPQEWTGGVAYTRYGRIAIGISPDSIDWGRRAIAHELTHLVVHQMTLNPYGGLPTWLEEGLAMRSEGLPALEFTARLTRAIQEERTKEPGVSGEAVGLISVRSLSSPFSAVTDLSLLSYAQSLSLVDFLVTTYGSQMMLELLEAFREGSTYDGALMKVYGFDTGGLDSRWRQSLLTPAVTVAVGVTFGG